MRARSAGAQHIPVSVSQLRKRAKLGCFDSSDADEASRQPLCLRPARPYRIQCACQDGSLLTDGRVRQAGSGHYAWGAHAYAGPTWWAAAELFAQLPSDPHGSQRRGGPWGRSSPRVFLYSGLTTSARRAHRETGPFLQTRLPRHAWGARRPVKALDQPEAPAPAAAWRTCTNSRPWSGSAGPSDARIRSGRRRPRLHAT
jgi:hypothetical protein